MDESEAESTITDGTNNIITSSDNSITSTDVSSDNIATASVSTVKNTTDVFSDRTMNTDISSSVTNSDVSSAKKNAIDISSDNITSTNVSRDIADVSSDLTSIADVSGAITSSNVISDNTAVNISSVKPNTSNNITYVSDITNANTSNATMNTIDYSSAITTTEISSDITTTDIVSDITSTANPSNITTTDISSNIMTVNICNDKIECDNSISSTNVRSVKKNTMHDVSDNITSTNVCSESSNADVSSIKTSTAVISSNATSSNVASVKSNTAVASRNVTSINVAGDIMTTNICSEITNSDVSSVKINTPNISGNVTTLNVASKISDTNKADVSYIKNNAADVSRYVTSLNVSGDITTTNISSEITNIDVSNVKISTPNVSSNVTSLFTATTTDMSSTETSNMDISSDINTADSVKMNIVDVSSNSISGDNANTSTMDVTTNNINDKVSETAVNYDPKDVHYEGDVAIYTEPTSGYQYKWDNDKNEWVAKHPTTCEFEDDTHTFTDSDGVKFFWDIKKKAWFPKINDDFMAQYQMNYGFVDPPAETKPEQPKPKPIEPPVDKGVKRKPSEPSWFELEEKQNTKVYVSNIPLDTTEEQLAEVMQKCGIIMRDITNGNLKIKMYTEKDSKTFKGDALITYVRVESVQLALDLIDGYNMNGNKLQVERAKFEMKGAYDPKLKPKSKRRKDKDKLKKQQAKLFDWRPEKQRGERAKHERIVIVKNVFEPKMFEEDASLILDLQQDLREECSKCGEVKKVVLFDRHPEGVAQINMKEPEAADACVVLLNGRWFEKRQLSAMIWDGKTKYKIAETDSEISQRLDKWDEFLQNEEKGDTDKKKIE